MATPPAQEHPMRTVRLAKITLNIGAGEPGAKLEKSKGMMEKIAGRTSIITKVRKRNTFGGTKGRPIGVKVTIRGPEALELLRRLLRATENKVMFSSFDSTGNFSFGVKEYINIQGVKYDPEIGILGLDVAVTLERPGYRIKRRALRQSPVGKRHQVTRQDAMDWAKAFGIQLVEKLEK